MTTAEDYQAEAEMVAALTGMFIEVYRTVDGRPYGTVTAPENTHFHVAGFRTKKVYFADWEQAARFVKKLEKD